VVVRAGVRLTGREIAVAASCGHPALTVTHSPKVAVISTGDELVEVEALVAPHQIRRSNDHAIRAALIKAGYPRADRFHLRDIRHEIEHMLWHILAEYDVVLITGGVSKGKFDFLPSELGRQGVRKIFQGVAQRPGKPFWFGLSGGMTPVFALPGNPVSAYTCLHRYVLPALDHASGRTRAAPLHAALAEPVVFKPKLACLLPVRLSSGPRPSCSRPLRDKFIRGFCRPGGTDGFVELPASGDDEFPRATWPPTGAGSEAPAEGLRFKPPCGTSMLQTLMASRRRLSHLDAKQPPAHGRRRREARSPSAPRSQSPSSSCRRRLRSGYGRGAPRRRRARFPYGDPCRDHGR
jgi:molybdopterin molybdotransferase